MKKNKNLSELMSYAGKHKYLTYSSLILSVVSAILALLPFVFIFFVIKEVIEVAPNYSQVVNVAHNGWMAVLFALISLVIYIGALMCSHLSAFHIAGNMRKTQMEHIAKLPLGFIGEMGSGKIRRIVNDSSAATETYLAHQLPDMAGALTTPLGMIVMLFLFDWRFGLICLVPVILGFVSMFKMAGPKMADDMKNYQNALADMNNEAVEYVRGVPVVKTFGQTVHTFKRFKGSIDNYYKFCIAYCKKCRMPMLLYTVFINSAFAFLITLALILTGGGAVTQSILLSLIFYVIFTPAISTSMTKVLFMSENGMVVNDALTRIHSILEIKPLSDAKNPQHPRDNSVEFQNVSFRYSGTENDAIKDVSFKVQPSETVALVGPSGGGKTTAAGLVSRFGDVTGGEIKVGGVDVKSVDPEQLLTAFSIVFQEVTLFNNTVMENIRIGRKDATDAEVMEAARMANCEEFVEKLPDKWNTAIGENGSALSGGERQRISIARAFLKDAPIILLDEATASLDVENETAIQSALSRLIKNKTVLLIAHRMRTVAGADKVVVLSDGTVAEQGQPDKLLSQNGIYTRMVKLQTESQNWAI
ncbi:lipid A export ATP-binding/permease protein MsbA [Clostridiales bacterium]|nr:lipid A export ATP-binding/permease protein MsbA [Clostridiales bacterium]